MKKNAFSLIELIIVILFLGILSVIAVLAVNSIYKEGASKSEETTKKMFLLMIDDYLVDDFNPADCTPDTTSGNYPYTCELNVLKNTGYIKSEVCNKADNKKIDLIETKFQVDLDTANNELVCDNCIDTFEVVNAEESCSDIKLEGGS